MGRPNKRTDRGKRFIPASPAEIWAAFADANAWAEWLPPEGMAGRIEHFDLRPGGSYRMVLTYLAPDRASKGKAGADTDIVEGRILAVEPGRRIVQETIFESDDPAFAGTMTITWSIAPAPGGAIVEIVCENVPHGIRKEDHDAGLTSTLDNLAAFVERRKGARGRATSSSSSSRP